MKMFLRNKKDGYIHAYNPNVAKSKNVEVVTEEEAFPEKFAPKGLVGKKSKVSLTTDEVPEEPATAPELAAEAAKGWPA